MKDFILSSKIEIIPAIDLIDGKCVRLKQGDFSRKKIYADDPLTVARAFEKAGIRRLHLVDLEGARKGCPVHFEILSELARETSLVIDYGGGLRTFENAEAALKAGANQITAGSIAVSNEPEFQQWIDRLGSEKIILGVDVKKEKIFINGWIRNSGKDMFDFLNFYYRKGLRDVICTDISRDGVLQGSALPLYEKILKHFPGLKLIASGGVNSLAELDALQRLGVYSAIIGKALYENKITLEELRKYVD